MAQQSKARSRARRLAMQALYQWQLSAGSTADIVGEFRADRSMDGVDEDYFSELVRECVDRREALEAAVDSLLDRPVAQLDPVERALLWIGVYEFQHHIEVPYRVVINESVELAKRFGADESHRYINAILDRAAGALRSVEISASRRG